MQWISCKLSCDIKYEGVIQVLTLIFCWLTLLLLYVHMNKMKIMDK